MGSFAGFEYAGRALIRVPLLPRGALHEPALAPDDADPVALRRELERLWADPLLREAVEVASPDLALRMDRVCAGRETGARRLRQTLRSLIAYRLRAAGRCTPFGLFAAVGRVEWSPDQIPEQGGLAVAGARRRGVRPDSGRLAELVRELEADERFPEHLRVVADNLCVPRGERILLPEAAATEGGREPARRRTLRCTPPVRAALELARTPITVADLVAELGRRFPGATSERGRTLVRGLISCGVLVTELRPRLQDPDPLGSLLSRLEGTGLGDSEEVKRLAEARDASAEYAAAALGAGHGAWRRAAGLLGGARSLHVDTALTDSLTLPISIVRDVAEAARVLRRLSPATDTRLNTYHHEFLERYGADALVPLIDLLDPAVGLGPPADYRVPHVAGRARPGEQASSPVRERMLAKLCARMALGAGTDGELVIDEELLRSCEQEADSAAGEAAGDLSIEVYARLVAGSAGELSQGSYSVVLLPEAGVLQAGAGFGRFAYLFGEQPADNAWAPVCATGGGEPVQLAHRVIGDRLGNVARVPLVTRHRAALGVFPDEGSCDGGDGATLDSADLEIGADTRSFHVYSRRLGREIVPVLYHLLNPRTALPNPVRFLLEAGRHGRRTWQPWDWGPLANATYLPGVRWGRVVLSEARWRVDDPALRDEAASDAEWRIRLEAWCGRWQVPRYVYFGVFDRRLPIDLDCSMHRELLRREVRDHGSSVALYPAPLAGQPDHGWLRGEPGTGAYDTEIVIPLIARDDGANKASTTAAATSPGRVALPPRRNAETVHLPGGDRLYAKIACPAAEQGEVLANHVAPLIRELPTGVRRWFFVRYADPMPHLRIRFEGDGRVLHGELLQRLAQLSSRLRGQGLGGSELELATYRPEVERYGGVQALAAAEAFFEADSRRVLDHLRAAGSADLVTRGAVDLAELVFTFTSGLLGPEDDAEAAWRAAFGPRYDEHQHAYVKRREELAALITPPEAPAQGVRESPWHTAAADYGRLLRAQRITAPWIRAENCLNSLMHMHCNRLFGIAPDAEAEAFAAARGAVNALLDRARALG
jgi:mRNA interferase HicA